MNLSKYEKSLIFILILLALYATFFFYQNNKAIEEIKNQEIIKQHQLGLIKNKIDNLDLEAKAVSIYDVYNYEEIYGKNENLVLPIASLAKIMTVLVALTDYLPENEIAISANALSQEGDNGLFLNEKWFVGDLAKFTLILSSNDGAVALSEKDLNFIDKMNEKAKRLGLYNTDFLNVSGLDVDDQLYGAVSTAREISELSIFALHAHPEIFSATTMEEVSFNSLSGFEHKIVNTNTLIAKIPNIMFSKTGNTDLAGGNLSIIFKNIHGKPIAITILGSSTLGRFSDMEKIVEVLYNGVDEDNKN